MGESLPSKALRVRAVACGSDPAGREMTGRTDMDFQDIDRQDSDAAAVPELDFSEPPLGSDRRAFMMRSALVSAMAVLAGRPMTALAQAPFASPALDPVVNVGVDPNLDVVRRREIAGRLQAALEALPPYHRGVIVDRKSVV